MADVNLEVEVATIKKDVKRTQEDIRSIKGSIDKMAETQQQLALALAKDSDLSQQIGNLFERVRLLEIAPAKRWDKVVLLTIAAVIGAAIGWVVG